MKVDTKKLLDALAAMGHAENIRPGQPTNRDRFLNVAMNMSRQLAEAYDAAAELCAASLDMKPVGPGQERDVDRYLDAWARLRKAVEQ